MRRYSAMIVWVCSAWWACAAGAAGPPTPQSELSGPQVANSWPVEVVELRDQRTYEGYIESQDAHWIHVTEIHRPEGRPTYLVIRPIERALVKSVQWLPAPQREVLRKRIEAFRNRSQIEQGRMGRVPLKTVSRNGKHWRHYRGRWFSLESTTDETLTRWMVVRVEQVFTAYRQILPPRTEPERPLRVLVFGSMPAYQAYLRGLGLDVSNPACYLPDDNLVVAGSRLAQFATQLAQITTRHDHIRRELDRLEAQLAERCRDLAAELKAQGLGGRQIAKMLRGAVLPFERQIEAKRNELDRLNRQNAQFFGVAVADTFAQLSHEAFHAYLDNYVFPHETHEVPRWLNEGLAVMFERGILEADTLRVDAPNRTALEKLKQDLAGEQPLPLAEVLAAGQREFLNDAAAQRYYVYAWGLAYYLTFEKNLLAGPQLQRYVLSAARAASPVERFEQLAGMPLSELEPRWRAYVDGLR